VSTTVTVPDQGTVLLGGQRLTQEIEVESGVPVLSKIPFINRFFNNRSMSREERTLLMLIRPQILIQNETEDKFFPGLREAIRTGGFGS
jgi:general secretion pathway protein D